MSSYLGGLVSRALHLPRHIIVRLADPLIVFAMSQKNTNNVEAIRVSITWVLMLTDVFGCFQRSNRSLRKP